MYSSVFLRKARGELVSEARKIKGELKEYLEDVELFADPRFWKAVEEENASRPVYRSVRDFASKTRGKRK